MLVSAGSEESVGALGFRAPSKMAVGGPDLMALAAAPAPAPIA